MRWLLVVSVLAGCASEGTTIANIHDPCAPLAVHLAEPTAARTAAVTAAAALWRDHGAPELDLDGGDAIEVLFRPAAGAFRGVYDDQAGVIYINDALTDPDTLAIVIAHELGHALGLPHAAEGPSVMVKGNVATTPTELDAEALATRWGSCPTSSSAPPGS